jgi:putative phage-type endonuclease
LDPKELEERKKGIGGSEVAAVLGLSPWQSPADVWARKKGLIPEQPENFAMKMGKKLEGPVAELYAEQENVELVKVKGSIWNEVHHVFGTPDRLVKGKSRGVEIKTANPATMHQWGEDGSGDIPLYYATQTALYMSLTGYPEWDVAVLFGTEQFRVYRLQRDLELENMILEKCKEFYERYVIGNEEPAPDASKAYANYLVKKYPANTLPMKQADVDEQMLMYNLSEIRWRIADWEKQELKLANELKARIGEAEGILSPDVKILWKKTKDKEVIDWEKIAKEYLNTLKESDARLILKENTSIKEGSRRFNVYPLTPALKGKA